MITNKIALMRELGLLIVRTEQSQLLVELIVCMVARGAAGRRMERGRDAWPLRSPRKGWNGESLFAPPVEVGYIGGE
jgi:hypothetical protein